MSQTIIRIFCDGVFDLLHEGHINHFKYLKDLYPSVYLMVGIMPDDEAINYKRKPFHTIAHRSEMVATCKYIDEIIDIYPIIVTKDFMDQYKIDLIVHAFSDENDIGRQLCFFVEPIKQNKFKVIPYNHGISTTSITDAINNGNSSGNSSGDYDNWQNIWNKKGNENLNICSFSGYENTTFDRDLAITSIISELNIQSTDKVLEIGCGAGYIAKKLYTKCNYYGIDYSRNLINVHHRFFPNNKIMCCEAVKLPFKTAYFDKIICNSVFEYFPDKKYACNVIDEMKRVSKSGIYILNIRHTTRIAPETKHKYDGVFTHTIYDKTDVPFTGFKIIDATFEHDKRFSAVNIP
jgi:cytidyltransferase-like protein